MSNRIEDIIIGEDLNVMPDRALELAGIITEEDQILPAYKISKKDLELIRKRLYEAWTACVSAASFRGFPFNKEIEDIAYKISELNAKLQKGLK